MKIIEVDSKVRIDDFEFYGQIEQEQFCNNCKSNIVYYDDFDTFFCPKCNSWIETKCNDSQCKYCPNRPDKPLSFK